MTFAAFAFAALAGVLIDYSSRPLAGGGHEYTIQVPPELIDTLRAEAIESYVPPEVRDVRRIRIQVGNTPLPPSESSRETPADRASPSNDATPPSGEPASPTANANDAGMHVAQYASGQRADAADDTNGETESATSIASPGWDVFGLEAPTLSQIGLGLAAVLIVCLAWLHVSMRARYRALLHRVHDPSRGSAP